MARTAIGMSRLSLLFISGLLLALGSPAGAETLTYAKFYKGKAPTSVYTGPFSGAGTVYDSTKLLNTNCPTTPAGCGSPTDRIADPMLWSGLGITATANAPSDTILVWNDLAPNFGGLGVGTGTPSNSDQIGNAGADILTMTFSDTVRLTGVGTLFAGAHTPFGPGFPNVSDVAGASGIAFLLSVDGAGFNPVTFALANAMGLSLFGKVFAFMQQVGSPEFYVSALSYGRCGPVGTSCAPPPPEVPIPGALPLFATGLIGLAWLGRRRKRKSAAALAA